MTTVIVNRPRSRNRANAPAVGSHLPTRNDVMAATIVTQTKMSDTMYEAAVGRVAP
jgi:hypothetical protein